MSTAVSISEQAKPVAKWKGHLTAAMPQIMEALPAHITADKFRQVAANAIGSTPKLKECMESNPGAVLGALMKCASDGLLPNGREAALVPFGNSRNGSMDLNYIPMISGVLKRMRASGEIEAISGRVVMENDKFEIVYGDEERIVHEPCRTGEAGKAIGAYAIIKLRGGESYREWMSASEIQKVKSASKARNGPWNGPHEHEMWRKTVLKRAAKYCPFSDEISTLMDRDNDFYDMSKTIEHEKTPAQERFPSLNKPARHQITYGGDEVPPKDISEEEIIPEQEHTDALPVSVQEEAEAAPKSKAPASSAPDAHTVQVAYLKAKDDLEKAETSDQRVSIFDKLAKTAEYKALDQAKQEELTDIMMGVPS